MNRQSIMGRKRRLHFKDLDAMRFFAFLPVFFYSTVYLVNTGENAFISDLSVGLGYLVQNSLDFFFFLSAFLLTSHALREYKYQKKFRLKAFYIRRAMRILPLFILVLLFTFLVHPWIVDILKLTEIHVPDARAYLLMFPNYFADFSSEQFIYLAVIWSIYMFLQFYVVWGLVLKFFLQHIKYVGYFFILIGLVNRFYHLLIDTPYQFDTLSAGVPVGVGAVVAHIVRNEERTVEFFKHIPKIGHVLFYFLGITTVIFGYLILSKSYFQLAVPLISCSFFGYAVIEQTYGKHSLFKLRNNKLISRMGKISYGLIVYHSVIAVIGLISIESLELNSDSLALQLGFIILTFFISWLVADLSYNWFERPILAIKKEFKHS